MPSTSSTKEFKTKAVEAYKACNWNEAIEQYSKAIEAHPKSHTLYGCRSAVYLKTFEYDKAIADADTCINLKPDYHKGYGRKAAAYHAMNEFDKSIQVYVEGLTVCSDTESLVKGLNAVKHAKMSKGKASKAAMTARMTRKDASARAREARKAKDIGSFVEIKRMELNLLVASLQEQLVLLDDLENMKDEDKMETLFYLVDLDGDGTVDAMEMASATRHLSNDLSLKRRADKVVQRVSQIGDTTKMNSTEFASYVKLITKEMNTNINDLAKFLVLQILFEDPRAPPSKRKASKKSKLQEEKKEDDKDSPEDKEAVDEAGNDDEIESEEEKEEESLEAREKRKERALSRIMADPRTGTIFDLFDKDGDGLLSFPEVAIGFYSVSEHDMKKSARMARKLLLALDKDDQRTLNFEQFGRLLMATTATAGLSFDEMADKLMIELVKKQDLSRSDFAALLSYSKRNGDKDKADGVVNFTQDRLHKLFEIWDDDANGFISQNELIKGLGDFKKAFGEDHAEKEARVLLGFDENGDNRLDFEEFCKAMEIFAQASEVNLRELIDFMCVTSVLGNTEKTHTFQEAYCRSLAQRRNSLDENAPTPSLYYEDSDNDIIDDSSSCSKTAVSCDS